MPIKIDIQADSKFPIDRKQLRNALNKEWNRYGFENETNLSIAIVGTRKMAQLHENFKGKKGPTDVLAFPQQSSDEKDQGFVTASEAPLELGDIVICYPLALEQAAEMEVLVDERIKKLALHGFSNLMGG